MQTEYHIWGIISSLLFGLTAYGLFNQLQKIYSRKALAKSGGLAEETPCSIISSNRTFGSFAAFYGNFFLGMCLPHFDWYLVGTRFIALVLLLLTLWEIQNERKDFWSTFWLFGGIALFASSIFIILFTPEILLSLLPVAKTWIVLALIFLLQGYIHQIYLLRKSKLVGGVSKFMFQMFLIKELSTIAFALNIDFQDSWPLILQHSSLLVVEVLILLEIHRIESNSN